MAQKLTTMLPAADPTNVLPIPDPLPADWEG